MNLATHEAVQGGNCGFCPHTFDAGDLVAQPEGDAVMCPACLNEHRLLEAA